MAKLFNRLIAYTRNNKKKMLKVEQRLELGRIVFQKYMTTRGNQKRPYKVTAHPKDVKGKVLYYPKEFTPEIDMAIAAYYQQNNLS